MDLLAQQKMWGDEVRKMFELGVRSPNKCGLCGTSDSKNTFVSDNQACHAGLAESMKRAFTPDFAHSYIMYKYETPLNSKLAVPFLHWLIHDSMYSEVFPDQDAAHVWGDGVLSTYTNRGANLVVGAHIAARRLTEHNYIVRNWYELVQRGVNGDLAFILAHCIAGSVVNGEIEPRHKTRFYTTTGHVSFYVHDFTASDVHRCMNKQFPRETEYKFTEYSKYYGTIDKMYKGETLVKFDSLPTPVDLVGSINFGKASDNSINPFPPARGDNSSYPAAKVFDMVAEAAIPYQEVLLK